MLMSRASFLHRLLPATMAVALALVATLPGRSDAQTAERIIISGASGNLGGQTVKELLARGVPASRLILVSRTPDELLSVRNFGVTSLNEIRQKLSDFDLRLRND